MRRYSLESARQVFDLFDRSKTREALRGVHEHIMAHVIGVAYDDPADYESPECAWDEESKHEASGIETGRLSPARSEVVRFHFRYLFENEIQAALTQHVIDKMERPAVIDVADLVRQFFADMRVLPEDFDSAYSRFMGNLDHCVLILRSTRPFPMCEVPRFEVFDESEDSDSNVLIGEEVVLEEARPASAGGPIWEKGGVVVEFLGEAPATLDVGIGISPDPWHEAKCLYAKVSGAMSESACARLGAEMSLVLPSVFRSVSLLLPKRLSDRPTSNLPWLTADFLHKHLGFARSCLGSYYATPSRKDSFDRRIHNAVHLLSEADTQAQNAIALALCVAAIEALLGEKGADVTSRLADHIAALLEPEPDERANAVDFFRDLYRIRCDVLHGRRIEGDIKARENARFLAAGVLSAIIARRVFLKRAGFQPEAPSDLFKELTRAKFQEGQAAGVGESNVRRIWRSRN